MWLGCWGVDAVTVGKLRPPGARGGERRRLAGPLMGPTHKGVTVVQTLLVLLVAVISGICNPGGGVGGLAAGQGLEVTHCGGYLNASHGIIQTPDFPVRFPTPISCQWLIHAPPGKKIVLYFTQYYMRESFKLTEYDYYEDPETFRGKHDLGEISFEEEVISYTVYKPYLVLKFQVQKIGNIHLRVFDFLLDVYGFNITYEIVNDRNPVRTDACSVFKCSFLGNCLATHNFETYRCHCFPGFFGDDCQYGPYCNPDKGINMCVNGGKCRYFFGSLVNTCECPPGYYGVLCEKKQEDFGNTECEKIGCNHKCVKDDDADTYRCVCSEGYRLMENNKTCMEKGRMRYNVRTRCLLSGVASGGSSSDDVLDRACPNFRSEFAEKVTTWLGPRLKEFDNFSIVNISLGEKNYLYTEMIFIGEKTDTNQARRGMYDLISLGEVCGCHLDKDYMEFDAKPALHMLTLENYDEKPILVGHLLTLVCRAKGSNGLQFVWLKDGAPVQVHRTSRNMWITTVPSSDDETRMSVLNIDHAHMLDEGEFTCRVTDWGETKTRTVNVRVVPAPHVEVTPLVTTVVEGATTRCKCLSSDDKRGDFKYRWIKDGELLTTKTSALAAAAAEEADGDKVQHANAEAVEDLFPIGSRLTVRTATRTERYTCVVTAPSGTANSSCQVNVAKVSMETRSCPEVEHLDVTWQQTGENNTDIKPCPGNEKVYATRRCLCWVESCKWEEPNFSRCTSPELLLVEQELTKLQLGYTVNSVSSVLGGLQLFLQQRAVVGNTNASSTSPARGQQPMLTGDLQLAMTILGGCQEYTRKFSTAGNAPTTGGALSNTNGQSGAESLRQTLSLASILLSKSRSASVEERRVMAMGQSILDLFESIRKDPRILETISSGVITAPSIELKATRASLSSAASDRTESVSVYSGRHATVTLPLNAKPANTDSFSNAITPRRARRQPRLTENVVIVTAVYENLHELLQSDPAEKNIKGINSQIVSVGPYIPWDNLDTAEKTITPYVDIHFEHNFKQRSTETHNVTTCLHWKSSNDADTPGAFNLGRCSLLRSSPQSTSCRCSTPGHFVVVMTPDTTMVMGDVQREVGIVPLIGCTVSLTGMVAALVVHLCFWRYFKDNIKVLTLNFCLAAIVLDCVLIAAFANKQSLILCRTQFHIIGVCFLAMLAFMTIELFHIRFTTLKAKLLLPPLRLCLIGWGVVACALIAVLICARLIGYSDMVAKYCWVVVGTWEMYAFLAPSVVVLAVYSWLLVLLIRDVTCHEQSLPQKERRTYIFYLCRSLVQMTYVLLSGIMSVVIVNSSQTLYQYIFAIAIAALGIIFFAFHCVVMVKVRPDHLVSMKELAERYGNVFGPCVSRVRSLLLSNPNTELPSRESTSSFKASIKPTYDPAKGNGTASTEVTTAGEDSAAMDPTLASVKRNKRGAYGGTARQEQLKALLGATSSDSSREADPYTIQKQRSGSNRTRGSVTEHLIDANNVDKNMADNLDDSVFDTAVPPNSIVAAPVEDEHADTLPPNYRTITEYIASLQKRSGQFTADDYTNRNKRNSRTSAGSYSRQGSASGYIPSGSAESAGNFSVGDAGIAGEGVHRRGSDRENHNSLCNCNSCGSTMPFKPARGRSFISDPGHSMLQSQTSLNSSASSSMVPGHPDVAPDPFPDISASSSSLSGSSTSSRNSRRSGGSGSRGHRQYRVGGRGRGGGAAAAMEGSLARNICLEETAGELYTPPLQSPLSDQLEPVMSYLLVEPQNTPSVKGQSVKGSSSKRTQQTCT